MKHAVHIGPLPPWLPAERFLGDGEWSLRRDDSGQVHGASTLETLQAADLASRVRGVTLAGKPLTLDVRPPLPRSAVRAARLQEARRQRARSPGFLRAGAHVDDGARIGLTPEDLALSLGRLADGRHVVDACCGAGGNAIGFARAGCSVTAIELDAGRLAMAKHNASLYGVSEHIEWICDDARNALAGHRGMDSLWFLDVPWLPSPTTPDADPAALTSFLRELLALRPPRQRAWAKVPASFDPALVDATRTSAWFGTGEGDARRVKFLIAEFDD